MAVSASAAAKRMCERSGWSLSNLELQKLLYIAHMFHLGETGEPLVQGHFEAWAYGPVHPALYRLVKIFGADPVQNIFHSVPDVDGTPEAQTLDSAVDQLGGSRSGRLVAITHWDGGAWAHYYVPGERGVIIPNEAILKEYNDRRAAAQARKQA